MSFTKLILVFQFLSTLGSADMAGEIGVIFNIPQLFTVWTRRLSQVIRISHHDFKQLVQPHTEDGKKIISNFFQVWKIVISSVLSFNLTYNFMKKLKEIKHHKRSYNESYFSLENAQIGPNEFETTFKQAHVMLLWFWHSTRTNVVW